MPSISLPAAVIGAGVLGAGAAIYSGSKASGAAKQAAQVQSDAANRAADLQQQRFEAVQKNLQPFVDFGQGQIPNLNSLLPGGDNPTQKAVMSLLGIGPNGLDPAARQKFLESTPGYQFTRDQGLRAVQNGFAAQGLGRSGAALKGGASFATGLADTTYEQQLQNYVNTWQNQFNNTYNSVALGSNAGAQLGTQGIQSGQIQGNFSTSGAAATAGGIVGGTNALTSGITGATGAIANSLLPASLFSNGFTPNGWTAPNTGLFTPNTYTPSAGYGSPNALSPYSPPPPGTFGP